MSQQLPSRTYRLLDADWLIEQFLVISMLIGSPCDHITGSQSIRMNFDELLNQSKRENAPRFYQSIFVYVLTNKFAFSMPRNSNTATLMTV